jgi:hypothetical protein
VGARNVEQIDRTAHTERIGAQHKHPRSCGDSSNLGSYSQNLFQRLLSSQNALPLIRTLLTCLYLPRQRASRETAGLIL